MKKLFALLLALGMLCSFAMAEEAEVLELSWDSVSDETKAVGSLYQIAIPDVGTLIYWMHQDMAPVDVNLVEAEIPPVAAFAANDEYTASVYVLVCTEEGQEAYLATRGVTEENLKVVVTNGIKAISFEQEEDDVDTLFILIGDNMIIEYDFTPLNGDEDWDAVKATIVASIQLVK